MIKNYQQFLNESVNKSLEKATDLAILHTLRQFLPNGGNTTYTVMWDKIDPIFSGDGPDFFINFDDCGDFQEEFDILYAAIKASPDNQEFIDNKFKEYNLYPETLSPDENIVQIENYSKIENVIDFYRNREKYIKLLEEKYKITVIGKKFGL